MITADKMHDNTMSLKAGEFTANLGNTSNDDVKECAMMGLIKNQKIDLEERLNNAKLKFADANLVKDNWSCAKEREIDCKVLEVPLQKCLPTKVYTRSKRSAVLTVLE